MNDYEIIKSKILPQLITKQTAQDYKSQLKISRSSYIAIDFYFTLDIIYVVENDQFELINSSDLDRWHVNKKMIHLQAFSNLRLKNIKATGPSNVVEGDGAAIYTIRTEDSLGSVKGIDIPTLTAIDSVYGKPFYIAVPNTGTSLFCMEKDLGKLEPFVTELYNSSSDALYDKCIKIDPLPSRYI